MTPDRTKKCERRTMTRYIATAIPGSLLQESKAFLAQETASSTSSSVPAVRTWTNVVEVHADSSTARVTHTVRPKVQVTNSTYKSTEKKHTVLTQYRHTTTHHAKRPYPYPSLAQPDLFYKVKVGLAHCHKSTCAVLQPTVQSK